MSPVMSPPGTIALSVQVWPPSVETNTGAIVELGPIGLGVNAVPTIWSGLFGLTASIGSLSCSASPLRDFGIMLTSKSVAISFLPFGSDQDRRRGPRVARPLGVVVFFFRLVVPFLPFVGALVVFFGAAVFAREGLAALPPPTGSIAFTTDASLAG